MTATKKFNILRAMMALFEVMDEEDNSNFAKVTTSPEALAKFIVKERFDGCVSLGLLEKGEENSCADRSCEECFTRWLKQEAEEVKE